MTAFGAWVRISSVQLVAAAAIASAGCGRIDFDPHAGGDAGNRGGDGATSDGAPSDATQGFGSGTISGTGCMGEAFPGISAAYSVGNLELPTETEIYLFASAVRCDEISTEGWDQSASSDFTGTLEFLGLEMASRSSGTYPINFVDPPASGSAFGTFYESSWPGPSSLQACISAPAGGSVTMTVNADNSVDATYSVMIQNGGTLAGTFHAASCATGWYPSYNQQ